MRQRKKCAEKTTRKPVHCGTVCLGISERHPSEGNKEVIGEMEWSIHDNGGTPARLSTRRAAHYENLKPHVTSPEDWCVPQNMEVLEYLIMEPACGVNEKGTGEKYDGNEIMSRGDNENIEVHSDEGSFAEEDWDEPEQNEVPEWIEPDKAMTWRREEAGAKGPA